MPTLKELKVLAAEQLAAYHATAERVRVLTKRAIQHKQEQCPHTHTQQVSEPGYFEPGRMSGPLPSDVYLVCVDCRKKLARQVEGKPRFVKLERGGM